MWFQRHQRRVGELIMIVSGIGITIMAANLGVLYLAYGGLSLMGLGVISVFWR
jgi:hypothetical protein